MKRKHSFVAMVSTLTLCLALSIPLTASAENETILSHIYTSPQITGGTNDHPLRNLWINGEYMYLCEEGGSALSTWDISNPEIPTKISSIPMPNMPIDIKGEGQYLYVSARNLLVVLSIANPSLPVIVGTVSTPAGGLLHGIYLYGERIYAADFSANTLVIFNVSNPTAPYTESQLNHSSLTGIHDVVVEWPFAYVSSHGPNLPRSHIPQYTGKVVQIDVSDPTSPQIVWVSTEGAQFCHITKSGNHIFAGGAFPTHSYLYAYDISGSIPCLAGKVTSVLGYWIAITGEFAITVNCDKQLAVVDISNPNSMSVVARWSSPEARVLRNVVINNEYVYAVSGNRIYGFLLQGGEEEPPPPEPDPPAPDPPAPDPDPPTPEPTTCFPMGDLIDSSTHIQISEDTYLALFPEEVVEGSPYKVRGVIFSK